MLVGLAVGADDYMTKPFSPRELVARDAGAAAAGGAAAGAARRCGRARRARDRPGGAARAPRRRSRPPDADGVRPAGAACRRGPERCSRASSCSPRSGAGATARASAPSTRTCAGCGASSARTSCARCTASATRWRRRVEAARPPAVDQGQARRRDPRDVGGDRDRAAGRGASSGFRCSSAGRAGGVLALAMVQFLARGMTSPLREMAAAASAMARGDYGRRVRATSRDEVGELARAFNAMAAELADVDRMRRDLIANVSHELRTPIGALQALLENLVDGVEPVDPASLRTALGQTERLGRLVGQLLDLSRLESGALALRPAPFPVRPLLEQATRECELGETLHRAARLAARGRAAGRPARDRGLRAHAPGDREPAGERGPPLADRRPRVAERARGDRRRDHDRGRRRGPGHPARGGRARVRALPPRRRRPRRARRRHRPRPRRSRAGSSTPTAARSPSAPASPTAAAWWWNSRDERLPVDRPPAAAGPSRRGRAPARAAAGHACDAHGRRAGVGGARGAGDLGGRGGGARRARRSGSG